MTGRRIILADGETFENGVAGYADGFLWLKLPECTPQECANTFTNKAKTALIVFQYGEMETEYKGFTQLVLVKPGEPVSVCMTTEEKDGAN